MAEDAIIRASWDRALREYREARARWDEAMDAHSAAEAAHSANPTAETLAAEERLDTEQERLSDIDSAAMIRLIETPAPDFDAAVLKVEFAIEWQLQGMPPIAVILAELREVVRREKANG
jgi:hypothetical protein